MIRRLQKKLYDSLQEIPSEYRALAAKHRWDENESIFFARELEYIKAKSYDKKYPFLKSRECIPMDTTANAGATAITYEQYDQQGMAKIISDYAEDLPRGDAKGKEFTSKIKTVASSYGYNFDELAAARMTGKSLTQRKSNATNRAMMVEENRIAFFGDDQNKLPGLFNNANVTEVSLAADGTGNAKTFQSKDADKLVRDIVSLPTQIRDVTRGVEYADTLLLPLTQWNMLANTRLPDTQISVREWILKENPDLKQIKWVDELKTAGDGNGTRMFAYRYDSDVLEMILASEFRQLPVQEKNLEFQVPCHMRVGGTLIYYPLACAYADGI